MKKLIRFIIMFLSFFIYTEIVLYLIIALLNIIGINYNNLNIIIKAIIMFLSDASYIVIYYFLNKEDLKGKLKDFKTNFEKYMDVGIRWWVIGFIVMAGSNLLLSFLMPDNTAQNQETVVNLIERVPVYMLFSVGIYAPFIEEMLFRKSIGDVINNKVLYVLISGLLFGSLHVITSMTDFSNLLHIIPYSALGITFAITYLKTKNIFVTIFIHSIHNTLAAIILIISNLL